MLWDKSDVKLVEMVAEKRGVAFALTACERFVRQLRGALDLASFDLVALDEVAQLFAALPIEKPDIIFLDEHLAENTAEMKSRLEQARLTETLPVLPIRQDDRNERSSLSLGLHSERTEIFLKTRALLRRERPVALRGKRQAGSLVLDEPRFKLFFAEGSADLKKADLCLLGPFFDVQDEMLDRQSLEQLAFAGNARKIGSRILDAQISRMRRRVKAQLGIDPLRSVRGIGYALVS